VTHRLDTVRASVKGFAIDAYMNVGISKPAPLLGGAGANELARAEHLRDIVVGSESDVVDALATTKADLDAKRLAAEKAARVAADRQRTANGLVASLRKSQASQLRLVQAAESRYQ